MSRFWIIAVVLLSCFFLGSTSRATAPEIAKVNGRSIYKKDLKIALSSFNEGQQDKILSDINSRRQILEELIQQELLVQEAEKEKLDQLPEYKDAMAAFQKQYMANLLVKKNLSSKLTDEAAKKYYSANKNQYTTDQVHAQHILVDTEAKAQQILKEVHQPKADFQALAVQHSKDPSVQNNRGDLGFFARDRMVREFADVAFGAKSGEIVGPVKTIYGYHVIKVVEKKPGSILGYDEVEMQVKNALQEEVVRGYVGTLRQKAKVQVNDTALVQ